MDFLGPRAIPALIAAASLHPLAAGAADCAALDGTYRYESAATAGASPRYLSDLTLGPERRKLFQMDARSSPGSLNPAQTLQRPKVIHLAATATVKHVGSGASLRFMDASGRQLAEMGIDATGRWTCKDARLERRSERTAGLGDVIRTERVEEALERNGAGDLVYRQAVMIVDPPGGKPVSSEARFPAVR